MDAIFKALNDPARRTLLDSLRKKDGQTLSELEKHLAMTRFGAMKHLKVLEDAHLVVTRKEGRFKYHYLNAIPLQEVIDRWIEPLLAKPAAKAVIGLKARLEGTYSMSKPDFVMSTYIRCTQKALWEALRSADAVRNYDFLGQTARRDGNAMIYLAPDGSQTLVAREIEVRPMTRLVTTFEPSWEAGVSRVVYLIEPQGDFCRLTVEHHDLTHPIVQGEGTEDGWVRTLNGLKTWLETGQPAMFGGPELWAQA